MNRLDREKRIAVVAALVEGNSVRSTCRLTNAAKGTVLKLLEDLGAACWELHDKTVRDVGSQVIQCDEIWSFCHCKERNVPEHMRGQPGIGDVWTWTALDVRSRLMVAWHVADRSPENAHAFLQDLLRTRSEDPAAGH